MNFGIIGAGPAGIFSALEIVKLKPDWKVILIEKGQESNVIQNEYIEENISAPIKQGQKIGEVKYLLNDNIISTCNIVAKENVSKINIYTMFQKEFWNWFTLLRD